MRLVYTGLIPVMLLTGCATHIQSVREFADETRKISVAFDPVIDGAVLHCRQKFMQRRIYTSTRPLSDFQPEALIRDASDTCQPIADATATAREMSRALSDYAGQLSALAADGVVSSVDDSYDALAAKLGGFKDLPPERIGAVSSLLKFISRSVIEKSQHQAIAEALNHEEAVGALADALVIYSDRIYGAYVSERLDEQPIFIDQLREESASPISARLRILDVYQQTLILQEQYKTTAALFDAVSQMKTSLHDLRQHLDTLTAKERLTEVGKLAKDVKSLYQQLEKAF